MTDARPIHIRIADDIRVKIETGDLQPGAVLPALHELAKQYRCSIGVVRSAVGLLRQEGLVVTRQGTGTFVRERPMARRHGMNRYERHRWSGPNAGAILVVEAGQQGHVARQDIRELAEVPVPDAVAEALRIKPGTRVWVRRRTTLIDDRPHQLSDSYFPLPIVDAAPRVREEDTGPGGSYARIEEAGIRLAEISERFVARMPTGPETQALDLPPGTPVVELYRTTYVDDGTPVEVMHSVIAGDMAEFEYRFPIPD